MTDFPDLKMKALVQFPARVNGGTGIDVTKTNGNYQLDLNFGDFAPPVTSIPTPTQQNALLWNSATDVYTLAPILSFGATASSATPLMNGVAAAGVSADFSRADHVHPVDTSRAPLASPTFSGTVTSGGPAVVSDTTASTTSTTGALKVAGGLGIAGDINWGGGAYAVTTPTITAGSGTFTAVAGTVRIKYHGKTAHVQATILVTTVGTAAGSIVVPLPTAALNPTAACAVNNSNGTINMVAQVVGSNLSIIPTAGVLANHNYLAQATYEIA